MKLFNDRVVVSIIFIIATISMIMHGCKTDNNRSNELKAILNSSEKIYFNSFVDCNMAEAWIGDTFRIFPGKYGEDPLWRYARDLKFADGTPPCSHLTRQLM